MSRTLIIVLAIPVLLVLAAAILIPLLLDEERVLQLASDTLKQETGATLTVKGESSLSFFPTLGVRLGETALTAPGASEPDLTARHLNIGVRLMPLFSGEVAVDTIELDGLVLTVRQQAQEQPKVDSSGLSDEQLDALYAQRRKEMEAAGQTAGSGAALAVPMALEIARLAIVDSRVDLVDLDSGETTTIRLLNLEATGLNLDGKPVPLNAQVELATGGDKPPIALSLDGALSLNAGSSELALSDVTLEVKGALPQTLRVEASGAYHLEQQVAELQVVINTGETRADGKLRYAAFESPQIDADLHLNLLDPALLALAGPEAAAEVEASDSDPTSGDEPLPLDAIRAIDTRANLAVDKAIFDGHAINNASARLRAVDGVIRLNYLRGELHGGRIDMKAVFNGKHNTARLNTEGGLTDMDISQALVAAQAPPALSGKASLKWALKGSGTTANELLQALNGPVDLVAADAVLHDMGVEKMLCEAVALVNQQTLSATLPEDSRFDDLSVNIQLGGGKARLDPLSAELPQVSLRGDGVFDLLAQDFKATFRAGLSAELAQLDPACRVNERLTDIDWPVACKGNISGDPASWCSVDTEEIIADLAKNEARRKIEKEAGKLFNKLFDKD